MSRRVASAGRGRHRLLGPLLAALAFAASAPVASSAGSAAAAGDGYPAAWAAMRCATPERDPVRARTHPCHNFEWGMPTMLRTVPQVRAGCYVRGADGALWQTCDPYGYSYRNCTSYVAWRMVADGVPVAAVRWLGDGGSWARDAPPALVDGTPAVGSAAVLEGSPGHVAYVDAVLASGAIRVSEYNKFNAGGFNTGRTIGWEYVRRLRFIHFERLIPANRRDHARRDHHAEQAG